MLKQWEKSYCEVRFGTEKGIGFPALSAIFDSAATGDSTVSRSRGGGLYPRIKIELSRC
jgi:hypothetical protein